jgi:gamma-glutamyl hercynylcysteine S-oxide synthase
VSFAADLADVRERTLTLVAPLPVEDLERQVDPLMSPLVWDLAHIAAYEDLWLVHRYGGRELLHGDLAAVYDAFETPRAVRGRVELLDYVAALQYLEDVRARTLEVLEERGPDPLLHEMVLRHELQHTETMLQAMRLGGLPAPALAQPDPVIGEDGWVEVPAGPAEIGAEDGVWAYDNERARHTVQLEAYRIARAPVTNAAWRRFAEDGGYRRREWWSADGWAWTDRELHAAATVDGDPDAPVCHVSWYEADAFARSQGARLPTEAEWERAAAAGLLAGTGRVWEWTSTEFTGYPGFVAKPYREYSEVFFGGGYRVLRGGSWATHPRVATPTFRNWDLPQRRQIFAGVRLAEDA